MATNNGTPTDTDWDIHRTPGDVAIPHVATI